MNSLALNILLSGGGTGGHLFPGIAIARKFVERNPENRILFVGTGNAFEISILGREAFHHQKITSAGLKGLPLFEKIKTLFKIPQGLIESAQIIRSFNPHVVIGLGGYSSGPVVLSAWLMSRFRRKIKIVLQEQNSIPGITNRILGRLADAIFISFTLAASFFTPSKVLNTGNPVRNEIISAREDVSGLSPKPQNELFTIFVSGGSQGAHRINLSIMEALSYLKSTNEFFFIHQTGEKDKEMVEAAYRERGIACNVQSFFEDMAENYKACDLIIARAGATTMSEITVIGRPAIFIPYPFAADNHQEMNARELIKEGAADMIIEASLTGKLLAEKLNFYRENQDLLLSMSKKAGEQGRPEASRAIVDMCYRMIGEMS